MRLDFLTLLKLAVEKRRQNIGWKVGGTEVHPGVFVHLAAEEAGAVGAFLADDLGALDKFPVIDNQRAAFSTGEVLSLMEGLGSHDAEGAQVFPSIFAKQAMSIILHHCHMIALCNLEDSIHLAAHACVVDEIGRAHV